MFIIFFIVIIVKRKRIQKNIDQNAERQKKILFFVGGGEGETDQTLKGKIDTEPGLGAAAGAATSDFPVYQGDPMLRPISEFEFKLVAKLLVKLSMAINSMMWLGDWSAIEERPLKIASLLYLVVWREKHQLPLFLPTKPAAHDSGSDEACLRVAVSSLQESLVIDCEALSPFSEVRMVCRFLAPYSKRIAERESERFLPPLFFLKKNR